MATLPPSPFINSVSPGERLNSLPSGESDPSVTSDFSPGESRFDGPDIPLAELVKRGFDEAGFLNDIEPLPAFLGAPSQAYLRATELIPVLRVLAGDSFMADIEPIRAAIARH